jgi:hypothetical protein
MLLKFWRLFEDEIVRIVLVPIPRRGWLGDRPFAVIGSRVNRGFRART